MKLDGEVWADFTDSFDQTVSGMSQSFTVWIYLDPESVDEKEMRTVLANRNAGCDLNNEGHGFAMFVNTWSTNDRSVQVEFGTATEDAVAFRLPRHCTCWKMDPAWACAHSIWLCRYRFCRSLNNCQWRGAWAPRRATWKYTQLPTLAGRAVMARDPLKATLVSWPSGPAQSLMQAKSTVQRRRVVSWLGIYRCRGTRVSC